MSYRTYGDLKTEVLIETDTEGEEFIQAAEVLSYFQDAVNKAAAHIHKLGVEDDYFLTRTQYSLTNGQQTLDMPANIYATKIRGLIYSTTEKTYQITKFKGAGRFSAMADVLQSPTQGAYYKFQIVNDSADDGFKIELYPYSQEDSTNCITMHYIREPATIVDDDSLVDIPQFYSFVKAFVKWKIYDKENSAKADDAKAEMEAEQNLMLETLAEMVPDYDSTIPADLSAYEEHS